MAKKIYAGQSFLWQWLFIFWVLYCLICPFRVELYAAWETGYTHRKLVTVQHANLDSDLTHFPLFFMRVDAEIDDNCDDDGAGSWDIIFTESDGTSDLDIDWCSYAEAGGNATIIAFVSQAGWVLDNDAVPAATTFYCYYENAGAGDPGTSEGVWDANYLARWSMDEAPASVVDSTSNSEDVTSTAGDPAALAGKILNGVDFDLDDTLIIANGAQSMLGATHTISFWYDETDSMDEWDEWMGTEVGGSSERWLMANYPASDVSMYWDGGGTLLEPSSGDIVDGDIHHVVIDWTTGSPGTAHIYIDGELKDSSDNNRSLSDMTGLDFYLGHSSANKGCEGILDEVRISDSIRGTDWAKFEYANINEADAELTWGAEESQSSYIPRVIIITGGYVLPGFTLIIFRRKKRK